MKTSTTKILNVLYVLSWIFFIAMLVEAGSYIFNMVYTLAFQPLAADYFHLEEVLRADKGYFAILMTIMTIAAVLKALALYKIARIFDKKKLDLQMPFNREFGDFIFTLAYLTLVIGITSSFGADVVGWIEQKNISVPDVQRLRLSGADVWIFMSATLYVIAQLFKRGIEIQSENELTI